MKIILILKGVLLYSTFLLAMLYIGGIDSIYDKGYFIPATASIIGLIYLCKRVISKEDYDRITPEYKDTEI